jgi:beta-lactamase class A
VVGGLTVAKLCEAAATLSDKTAAHLLPQALNGPAGLTAWLRGVGDEVIRLAGMEPALDEAQPGDLRDTSSPTTFLVTMQALTLSGALRQVLRDCPVGWIRANRTGGGGRRTGSVVGPLWPPDGGAPRLVVPFLAEGPADATARDAALAEAGTAVAAARTG